MSNESTPDSQYIQELEAAVEESFADSSDEAPRPEATFHTILEVWHEVLKPALEEKDEKVTPAFANKIVSSYRGIEFENMNAYRDRYFEKIVALLDILKEEIATDEECLTYTSPEEDVANNSEHYREMLFTWQEKFLRWEMDWDCTAADAAIELGALSEVHKMFFGEQGLTQFLDNIKFQFTDEDQYALITFLNDIKEGK